MPPATRLPNKHRYLKERPRNMFGEPGVPFRSIPCSHDFGIIEQCVTQ